MKKCFIFNNNCKNYTVTPKDALDIIFHENIEKIACILRLQIF